MMSSRGTRKLTLGQNQFGGFDNEGNDTGDFTDLPL